MGHSDFASSERKNGDFTGFTMCETQLTLAYVELALVERGGTRLEVTGD